MLYVSSGPHPRALSQKLLGEGSRMRLRLGDGERPGLRVPDSFLDFHKWSRFPETRKEFQPSQSFRTHSLVTLLSLSGQEQKIISAYLPEWSAVATWDPEGRYKRVGSAKKADAVTMTEAARVLARL